MLARERQESNTLFLLTPSQVSASSCQLTGREKKCAFSRQHPAAIKLQEKSCLLHSMQTWNIGGQQSMRLDADPWIKVQISSWTVQEALRGNNQLWTWPWVFLVNCLMTLSQKLKYTALILGFSGHLHISVQSKVLT